MAVLTVRGLPDEVRHGLRLSAAKHGRSMEAEAREILALAVKPERRLRMGAAMAALARESGVTDQDVLALEQALDAARNKRPAEPMEFE